jgi:hypothetical protein
MGNDPEEGHRLKRQLPYPYNQDFSKVLRGLKRNPITRRLARLRAQMEERVCYWQEETERARATASRLSERTAAWAAGCQQGREDVLSLARALAQHGPRHTSHPQS